LHKNLFDIEDGDNISYGGSQGWYNREWSQKAGCGPTTASNIVWYLASTRENLKCLCEHDGFCRAGFVDIMSDMWGYVTPGSMGVNKISMLTKGIISYAAQRGAVLKAQSFPVPRIAALRAPWQEAAAFLTDAMARDLPVAFLNLSKGELKNLDTWHWVTITAFDDETGQAEISDEGVRKEIDMRLWYRTTKIGGGLAALCE
jgi:hypothetical protein